MSLPTDFTDDNPQGRPINAEFLNSLTTAVNTFGAGGPGGGNIGEPGDGANVNTIFGRLQRIINYLGDIIAKLNNIITGGGVGGGGGKQYFTSSGVWTRPVGVNVVRVILWGGGGGGGGGPMWSSWPPGPGGFGGGSGVLEDVILDVSAHSTIPVTIGTGGHGGHALPGTNLHGGNGGVTSFGTLVSANGGNGGARGWFTYWLDILIRPDGGSGGGSGSINHPIIPYDGGSGTDGGGPLGGRAARQNDNRYMRGGIAGSGRFIDEDSGGIVIYSGGAGGGGGPMGPGGNGGQGGVHSAEFRNGQTASPNSGAGGGGAGGGLNWHEQALGGAGGSGGLVIIW